MASINGFWTEVWLFTTHQGKCFAWPAPKRISPKEKRLKKKFAKLTCWPKMRSSALEALMAALPVGVVLTDVQGECC